MFHTIMIFTLHICFYHILLVVFMSNITTIVASADGMHVLHNYLVGQCLFWCL